MGDALLTGMLVLLCLVALARAATAQGWIGAKEGFAKCRAPRPYFNNVNDQTRVRPDPSGYYAPYAAQAAM